MRRCQWAFEGQLYAAGRCPAGLAWGHVLPHLAYPPSQAHPPSGKEGSLLCWFYHPQTFHVRPIVHIDFDQLYYRQACSWQMLSTLLPTTMGALEIYQSTSQVSTSIKLFCFFHRQWQPNVIIVALGCCCSIHAIESISHDYYRQDTNTTCVTNKLSSNRSSHLLILCIFLWTKIPVQSCPPWYLNGIVSADNGAW